VSKALSLVERLRQKVQAGDLGDHTQSTQVGQVAVAGKGVDGNVHYTWDRETERLVQWVRDWQPGSAPLILRTDEWDRPTLTVEDQALFKQGLLVDIAAGPGGTRSRTGALQSDLARLYQLFGGGDGVNS
jgi:hypothetical protein